MPERIQAIPDGTGAAAASKSGGRVTSSNKNNINFETGASWYTYVNSLVIIEREFSFFMLDCCFSTYIIYDCHILADGNFTEGYFAESEESSQFRNEYETRKKKQEIYSPYFYSLSDQCSPLFGYWYVLQDEGLDVISEGLDTLKNLANDMNEVG